MITRNKRSAQSVEPVSSRLTTVRLPAVLGAYAFIGGLLTLTGWFTNIRRLTDWDNDGISMKANAAICMIAAAFCFLMLVLSSRKKWLPRVLAGLTLTLAGLTLLEHLSGFDFGIDMLLFTEPPGALATASPGRMGIPACASFILLATAILLFTGEGKGKRWAANFSILAVAIASLSLIGYFYNASQLYSLPKLTGIAMQTASMIFAIGVGLILSVPESRLMTLASQKDAGGVVFRRLFLPVVLIPVVAGRLRLLGQEMGLYDTAFGAAIFTFLMVGTFLALLWWTATGISLSDQALQGSKRHIETVLTSIGDAVIATDRDGNVSYLNPIAAALTGWTFDEAREKPLSGVFRIVNEESRKPVESPVEKVLREGSIVGLANHTVLLSKDGREIPIADSASPIRAASGEITGVVLIFRDQTAEREAESALRASEERATGILESITDGFHVIDAQGRFTYFNAAGRKMFAAQDLDAEALLGRRIFEVFPDALKIENGRAIQRTLSEGVVTTEESFYAPWQRWLSVRNFPTPEGGVATYFQDTTERKKAEAELCTSEERLRLAAETAKFGVHDYSVPTDNSIWSTELYSIMGLPKGAPIKLDTAISLVHPEDRARIARAMSEGLEPTGTGEFEEEFRVLRADTEEVRWVYNRCKTIFAGSNGSRSAVRNTGVVIDITERKRVEEALRKSEEQIRFVTDHVPVLIVHCDTEERFKFVNKGYAERFHLRPNEAVGKTIVEVVGAAAYKKLKPYVERALRGEQVEFEEDVHYQYGARWMHGVYVPQREPSGAVSGFVAVIQDVTSRRETEEALRESEERFRLMANSISQLAWMAKGDGWIFWYNQRWYDYTGTTPKEMEGWGWEKVHDPKELPRVVTKWKAAHVSGEPWEDLFPLRRHDGELRRHLSRAQPLKDAEGKVVLWFGTNTDVEEQLRSEQLLAETRQRLDLSVNAAELGTFYCPMPLGRIEWNEKCKEHFWLPPDAEIDFDLFYSVLHPKDRERTRLAVEQAVHEEKPYDIEYRTVAPDGRIRWIRAKGRAFYDEARNPTRFDGITIDISDQKRAEEALRERENVLRTVTAEAQVGLVMVNNERQYLFANQTYAQILGLTDHNIIGKRVSDVLSHLYSQISPRLDRAFAGERVTYELHMASHPASGDERFYQVVYEPRITSETEPYVVVVLVDITERKKAEQLLEQTVEERTAKLKETIGELEAFSYSISHDMRSPLRTMQGFSKILLEEHSAQLNESGRALLERIQKASTRLDLLIQDVLAYSRIAKGEHSLTRVHLDTLVPEILEQYGGFDGEKAVVVIERPLPSVLGHEALLSQIVSNLVGNAVKFVSPGSKPTVRIRSEFLKDRVKVWVEDNGIGIDPMHYKRIFEIFGRVYADKKFQGTGIGLAVVKKAVERMGGEVGVESEVGKGSRFWFTIQRAV